MIQPIHYRKGYKYQLDKIYSVQTKLRPEKDILTAFLQLYTSGLMTFQNSYAWDGCSGPTWDNKTNMRGGLVHDGGYQLLRLGLLSQEFKEPIDRELQRLMLEDGAWKIRAWYYYQGVHLGGSKSCSLGYEPYPVLTAP